MNTRRMARRAPGWLAAIVTLIPIAGCDTDPGGHPITPNSPFEQSYRNAGRDVMKRFPTVVSQDEYDWNNGYIMGFRTKPISKAAAKKIADYAYPEWVAVREKAGMDKQTAGECAVMISNTQGDILYPPS